MSLGQHLIELRKRLFRSAIGVVLGAVVGWIVYPWVWDGLRAPIEIIAESRNAVLNYQGITTAFDVHMQIAIYVGILVSSPIWLYQLFAFLVPGLTGREKRYTFGFVFTAIPLFLAGCAAGWFVVPHIVILLNSFVPPEDASFIEAKDYLGFVLKLILAVGVAFVLPVFLVLLNFVGVLSGRTILKGWRIAILTITLFTAIATPAADPFSMFLLAIPMVFLYFVAVGVAYWHDAVAAKRAKRLDSDLGTPSIA
ncbi:twin-arginine translocase subunit TatC [Terrimesophilobacter mesophilus]|uniref:Sec-independent protein translocase protein TatC n=1 Tax=Terrimesophilobacter mesophilus TaxID=433647 RepID=A0A4R8VBK3_9MICO|nr:twin-arginine translocase subunit TatC [Terrimesophilobacter mesophilus]